MSDPVAAGKQRSAAQGASGAALRRVERVFWLVGLLALGYCAWVLLDARLQQFHWSRQLDRAVEEPGSPVPQSEGSTIGRLTIPRIGLSAMVLEGSDERTLQVAVGHVAGSALPGQAGNVVLAGHRDSFFRPLREIRKADTISLRTKDGTHQYRVDSTAVIEPEQTEALRPSVGPTLTLVTCYPFHYIGPAPKRFVVRALEVKESEPQSGHLTAVSPNKVRARGRDARPPLSAPAVVQAAVQTPEADAAPEQVTADMASLVAGAADNQPPTVIPTDTKGGIRRINPVRLFGKLARVIRRAGSESSGEAAEPPARVQP